jgi:hypothetical protein
MVLDRAKTKLRSQDDKIKQLTAQLTPGKAAAPEPDLASAATDAGPEEGEAAEAPKPPAEDPETL